MVDDWVIKTMYATKRRRKNPKSIKPLGAGSRHEQNAKSNPSKRHRERLNSELEHLASLLPFEQNVIVKLDKLSILRLAVSYLRMKCYFQSFSYDRMVTEHRLVSHLYHCPVDLTRIEGEACLQALNGFIFIMSCDGEVFSVSKTVEHYLGFHQADILHQSVLELIHSEDREEFRRQLSWRANLPPELQACTLNDLVSRDLAQHLQRRFTVRFRCLLDNTSGFITLELSGRLQFLHGQARCKQTAGSLPGSHLLHTPSGTRPMTKPSSSAMAAAACQYNLPPLGLFVVCSPLGPLPSLNGSQRDMTFKTKHQLDLTITTVDSRTRMLFNYTDADLQRFKIYDLVHPEDLQYVAQGHREVFRTGSVGLLVHRWINKSCEWIWLQSRVKLMMKNGKQDHIILIHRQLSQQEGMELLIRRSDEYKLPFPLLEPETLLSEENLSSSMAAGITDYNGPFAVSHLKELETTFLGSIINGGDRNGGCLNSIPKASMSDYERFHGTGHKREPQQSSSFGQFSDLLSVTNDYSSASQNSTRSPLTFSAPPIKSSPHSTRQTRQQVKEGNQYGKRKKNPTKHAVLPAASLDPYGYTSIPGPSPLSPALRLSTDDYPGSLYNEAYMKPEVCPFDSSFRSAGTISQLILPTHGMSRAISDMSYSGCYFGLRNTEQYSAQPASSLAQYAHQHHSFGFQDTSNRSLQSAGPSGQEMRPDFGVHNLTDSYNQYSSPYDAYSAAMAAAAMVAAASSYHPQSHNPNLQLEQLQSHQAAQRSRALYSDYVVPPLYQGVSRDISDTEQLDTQHEMQLHRQVNREHCSPTSPITMGIRDSDNRIEVEMHVDKGVYHGTDINRSSFKPLEQIGKSKVFQRHLESEVFKTYEHGPKLAINPILLGAHSDERSRSNLYNCSELDLTTSKVQSGTGPIIDYSNQPKELYTHKDPRQENADLPSRKYSSFPIRELTADDAGGRNKLGVEPLRKVTHEPEDYHLTMSGWRQQPTVGSLELAGTGILADELEEHSNLKESVQHVDNKSTSSLCSSTSSQMHSPVSHSQAESTHIEVQDTRMDILPSVRTQSPATQHFWEYTKPLSKSSVREQLTYNSNSFLSSTETQSQHYSGTTPMQTNQQYTMGNAFNIEEAHFQTRSLNGDSSRNPSPVLLNRTEPAANVGYYRESLLGSI